MTDTKKLSGAAAFRERRKQQEAGETLELSSGMVVRVKRPNESKLIQNGQIPSRLAMSAINVQSKRGSPDDLKNFAALQQLYARLTVVDPIVVEGEPTGDNEISVDEFDAGELTEIYIYVTGGMDGLRRFREERERVFARSDSETIPGYPAE